MKNMNNPLTTTAKKRFKKDDRVKIIKCDCSFWPLEHNNLEGDFESNTIGGNYYVHLPYARCIAKEIVKI